MSQQEAAFMSVNRTALASALQLVPVEARGEFALRLLGLNDLKPEATTDEEFHHSYALTPELANQLMQKLDTATRDLFREALANVKDGVAVIDWADVKRITGVTNWAQFARGRLGGVHRSLNSITQSTGAKLLIEGDGWVEDGKGDFSAGTLFIDGPAVQALQAALGVK
ncbi:hypothetical protein [Methylobacterium sp. CCH5-D2]|uniref:hypothetical protein n=1 Tax=Methylobacterium sp. CCH5-D2 TaxID=1768765 RepID=UPI000A97766B|nr:hypothetical protein [Methylobacterium sp. CCH5-D2]